jgi:hypothetical protein
LVARLGGWTALAVLRAVLVGIAFACLFRVCRREGLEPRTAALLTIGAFVVASFSLALRPQLIGIAIFAALLWVSAWRHDRPRLLWLSVPLLVVWANLHGSFVLGLGLLGLFWIEDAVARVRRPHLALAVAAAAGAAVTLLNPFGLDLWRYAIGFAGSSAVASRVSEWQPSTPGSAEWFALYGSAIVVALLIARRHRRPTWPRMLTLAVFFGLGVVAVRGLAWWPLVAAMTVAERYAWPRSTTAATRDRGEPPLYRRINLAVTGALVVVGVALLPIWRPLDRGLGAPAGLVGEAPSRITAALHEIAKPGDRLFASQPWGSWFEYSVPQASVFVDSRVELFPADIWAEYGRVLDGGSGWQAVLDGSGVTIVVAALAHGQQPLADRLRASPGWREVHADPEGVIFVKIG